MPSSYIRPLPESLPPHRRPSLITISTAAENLHRAIRATNSYLHRPFLPITTLQSDLFSTLASTGAALSSAVQHPDRLKTDSQRQGRILAYQRALRALSSAIRQEESRIANRSIRTNASYDVTVEDIIHELQHARDSLSRFRVGRTGIIRFDYRPVISHDDESIDLPVVEITIDTPSLANSSPSHHLDHVTIARSPDYDDTPLRPYTPRDWHHPHVSGPNHCWGSARAPLESAISSGSFSLLSTLLRQFLDSYNHDDPYIFFSDFANLHPLNTSPSDHEDLLDPDDYDDSNAPNDTPANGPFTDSDSPSTPSPDWREATDVPHAQYWFAAFHRRSDTELDVTLSILPPSHYTFSRDWSPMQISLDGRLTLAFRRTYTIYGYDEVCPTPFTVSPNFRPDNDTDLNLHLFAIAAASHLVMTTPVGRNVSLENLPENVTDLHTRLRDRVRQSGALPF